MSGTDRFRQQLVAENALHDRVAIVETIDIGDVEAPVDMVLLGGVGQAFDPENKLIELDPVGVDRIAGRRERLAGGAGIGPDLPPAVKLDAAVLPRLPEIGRAHV